MTTDTRENTRPAKQLHWIRWPLTLATLAGIGWLVHAMVAGDPGSSTNPAQTAFGMLILLGIGTALSWTIGRGTEEPGTKQGSRPGA